MEKFGVDCKEREMFLKPSRLTSLELGHYAIFGFDPAIPAARSYILEIDSPPP